MLTRRNWLELSGAAGLAFAGKGRVAAQTIDMGNGVSITFGDRFLLVPQIHARAIHRDGEVDWHAIYQHQGLPSEAG